MTSALGKFCKLVLYDLNPNGARWMFVKNVPINLESLPENISGEYFFGAILATFCRWSTTEIRVFVVRHFVALEWRG
jgi:hypothetical protein